MATDYNGELNFIVEHVGLPRIEDFCFMATQEPNVYAGLSVVVGGLMHARPKFFAKVMGELLFWVGEDKMLFGSDYAIWEPKWQIEGLVDWEMPDEDAYSDFPRLDVEGKKKILGLNAAKLYDVEVPEELQIAEPATSRAAQEDAQLVEGAGRDDLRSRVSRRRSGRSTTRSSTSRSPRSASSAPGRDRPKATCRCGCGSRRRSARRTSRS